MLRVQLLAYWELDGNADDSTGHKRHLEVHPSNDQHWGSGLHGSQALELSRDVSLQPHAMGQAGSGGSWPVVR